MKNYAKQKWLSLSICLVFTLSLLAQVQEPRPFRFGLKASPNLGWIKPDTRGINSNGAQLGFNYGLVADFTLGNSFNYALSTGLEIASFGGKLTHPDVVSPVDTLVTTTNSLSLSSRYVNIPLTIKMKTNEIGYNTYFANFGITTGLRIRARQDNSYTLPTGNLSDENVDVIADIAPFRLGMVIGGGVEYNFHGKTALLAGFTFNNGFTNLFTKNKKFYELDTNGDIVFSNGTPVKAIQQRAISNFFTLDIGLMF